MKKEIFAVVAGILLLSGCGKKEDPQQYLSPDAIELSAYRFSVNVRQNFAAAADKRADYVYNANGDASEYFGTDAGTTYYKLINAAGEVTMYANGASYEDLWTHDDIPVVFEDYDKEVRAYFRPETIGGVLFDGQAELRPENGDAAIVCDVYKTEDASKKEIWDPQNAYTTQTARFYISEERLVYAAIVLTGEADGNNATITVNFTNADIDFQVASEDAFVTLEAYQNTQNGVAMTESGETALDLMEISVDEIKEQEIDGFYYADGTFVYSKPTNYQSWKHIVGGKVTEEFDIDANQYINYETGEIRDEVVEFATFVDDDGVEQTYVNVANNIYGDEQISVGVEDLVNVYELSYNQIRGLAASGTTTPVKKDYITILGYDQDADGRAFFKSNPELVPKNIQNLAQEIYNDWKLQDLLDRLSSGKMTEDEKYIIACFAHRVNMPISQTEVMMVTFKDLLNSSGLDVDAYYQSYKRGEGPFLTYQSYKNGGAGSVNPVEETPEPTPTAESAADPESAAVPTE